MNKKNSIYIILALLIAAAVFMYFRLRDGSAGYRVPTEQDKVKLLEDLGRSDVSNSNTNLSETNKEAILKSLSEKTLTSSSTPSVSNEEKMKILRALQDNSR